MSGIHRVYNFLPPVELRGASDSARCDADGRENLVSVTPEPQPWLGSLGDFLAVCMCID